MSLKAESDDPPEALSIGSIIGGTGANPRAWQEHIRVLSGRVAEAQQGVESPLCLNVIFHVPGEVLAIEGDYVRTGHYDAHTRHLVVQATVPETPPDEPALYLLSRLGEAVEEAEEWVKRRRVASGLPALWNILDDLT